MCLYKLVILLRHRLLRICRNRLLCELYARIAGVTAPDTAFEGPTGATGTFTTSFDVIAGSTGTEFTDINVTT